MSRTVDKASDMGAMEKKDCFGILEKVFPVGDRGMREVRAACFQCPDRVACLKAALDTREGLEMQLDALERQPSAGFRGRLQRWSRKKALSRSIEERKGKGS
jgi:hypothetical protein